MRRFTLHSKALRAGFRAVGARGSVQRMSQSRLQALEAMAVSKPDDAMIHYGLGLEYRKAGELEKAADAFGVVVRVNPSYTAAFQELGAVLVALGRVGDARRTFVEGVAVADRTGAWKAREHIGRLLAELDASNPTAASEFCDGGTSEATGQTGPIDSTEPTEPSDPTS